MMRDLAEFIMRGRWQALAIAVIGSVRVIAAPVSAAAIALVTLGRSVRDGAWVVLWSMLPALLLGWVSGDYGTGLLLLSVFAGAVVLAQTYSLSLALLAVVPMSALGGVVQLAFNSAFLDALLTVFDTWIEALESGADETAVIGLLRPSVPQVAGLMAVGNSLLACISCSQRSGIYCIAKKLLSQVTWQMSFLSLLLNTDSLVKSDISGQLNIYLHS